MPEKFAVKCETENPTYLNKLQVFNCFVKVLYTSNHLKNDLVMTIIKLYSYQISLKHSNLIDL